MNVVCQTCKATFLQTIREPAVSIANLEKKEGRGTSSSGCICGPFVFIKARRKDEIIDIEN